MGRRLLDILYIALALSCSVASTNVTFSPSLGTDISAWHVWGNAFVNIMSNRLGQTFLYHQLRGETFIGGSPRGTCSFGVHAVEAVADDTVELLKLTQASQKQQTLRPDGVWTQLEVLGLEVSMDHRPSMNNHPAAIVSQVEVKELSSPTKKSGVYLTFIMQSLTPTPLMSYSLSLLAVQKRFEATTTVTPTGVITTWNRKESDPNMHHASEIPWLVSEDPLGDRVWPYRDQTHRQLLDSTSPLPPLPLFVNVTGGKQCVVGSTSDSVHILTGSDIHEPLRSFLPSGYGPEVAIYLPSGSNCTIEFGILTQELELPAVEKFTGEMDPDTFSWQIQSLPFPNLRFDQSWLTAMQKEAKWKLAQLASWCTYRSALGTFSVPQGSVYEYTISEFDYIPNTGDMLRDTGLLPVLAAGVSKSLARSYLENNMRLQQGWPKGGEIPYSWFGQNATAAPFGVHSDTDMQLFLGTTLALEHGAVDCDWLMTKEIPFLGSHPPLAAQGKNVSLTHLSVALHHFMNKIGRGPHGLVRAMDGDWSDNLVSNVQDYDIKLSESVMVTGLAVVVLRRFSLALTQACSNSKEVSLLVNQSLAYRDELKAVMADRSLKAAAWTSAGPVPHYTRALLYSKHNSSYDAMGLEFVDLNAQLWPLMSTDEDGLLSPQEREALLDYVHSAMDRPNPFGASIVPLDLKAYPGLKDIAGYMESRSWARPSGLLVQAYIHNNRTQWAWDLLRRSSSTHHCTLFPGSPLGCVSGPDAVDSGGGAWNEALVEDMTTFPWANANPNAMWLWGLMALANHSQPMQPTLFV